MKTDLGKFIRDTTRQLGIGKALLRIHQLRYLTIEEALKVSLAKRRYLTNILNAKPIPSGLGAIEVHMLLHHKRIYEGLWALYSFAYFCAQPCRIVVHNDGSLSNFDVKLLNQLFPQCQVIDRKMADSVVENYLRSEGLFKCLRIRQKVVHVLKLFDPCFFSTNNFFISLDSDVLFFSRPQELINGIESVDDIFHFPNLYSQDVCDAYSLKELDLVNLLQKDPIKRLNAGVLRVNRGSIDFKKIEEYLKHPDFYHEDGRADYYTEQTLWAMEFTRLNALPLPNTYAICPSTDEPNLVSGHFCGGGYWASLLYTRGLPRLAETFFY
ncbi:MAG: hypothetical protein KME23_27795 [Goleter apudmare HA4340-LM2]|jgi:hypothetical protein|nr:hypothetical protein [Goleter apudmare HA4340-LM2]